jgi:hypothetical protein
MRSFHRLTRAGFITTGSGARATGEGPLTTGFVRLQIRTGSSGSEAGPRNPASAESDVDPDRRGADPDDSDDDPERADADAAAAMRMLAAAMRIVSAAERMLAAADRMLIAAIRSLSVPIMSATRKMRSRPAAICPRYASTRDRTTPELVLSVEFRAGPGPMPIRLRPMRRRSVAARNRPFQNGKVPAENWSLTPGIRKRPHAITVGSDANRRVSAQNATETSAESSLLAAIVSGTAGA